MSRIRPARCRGPLRPSRLHRHPSTRFERLTAPPPAQLRSGPRAPRAPAAPHPPRPSTLRARRRAPPAAPAAAPPRRARPRRLRRTPWRRHARRRRCRARLLPPAAPGAPAIQEGVRVVVGVWEMLNLWGLRVMHPLRRSYSMTLCSGAGCTAPAHAHPWPQTDHPAQRRSRPHAQPTASSSASRCAAAARSRALVRSWSFCSSRFSYS
jgi:hypothetical protein